MQNVNQAFEIVRTRGFYKAPIGKLENTGTIRVPNNNIALKLYLIANPALAKFKRQLSAKALVA